MKHRDIKTINILLLPIINFDQYLYIYIYYGYNILKYDNIIFPLYMMLNEKLEPCTKTWHSDTLREF